MWMRYGSPNFAALNWSSARVARAKQVTDTAHRMSTASTGFATAAPQAPLDAQLLTFPSGDLRGHQSDGPLSHVHHDHPLVDASLWGGQPHPWSSAQVSSMSSMRLRTCRVTFGTLFAFLCKIGSG